MGVRTFETSQVRAISNPYACNEDTHRLTLIVLLGDDREPRQRHCTDNRDSYQKDPFVANHVSSPIPVETCEL